MDFYIRGSKILAKLDSKAGSIKGLTLQSGEKDAARTYALILETLKYRAVLLEVITKSDLLVKERKLAAQGNLALILVHDLLLNKKGIVANSGPFKDAVMRHKTRLNAEWIKAKIKLRVKDNTDLAKVNTTFIPRWARINTLKVKTKELLDGLPEFNVVRNLKDLELHCIYIDEHIDNLIAFSPNQNLTNHKLYHDGSLILQNKASCIPAAVLDPPFGATVIDACAAPGNKTTHLAALLQKSGNLFAFERDNRRVLVLRDMLKKACANAEVIHGDFTRSDPRNPKFAHVTHLLLDPSCSGSGIVNRLDYLTEATPTDTTENDTTSSGLDHDRLESLSSFQLALLLHAMKFPAAEKITYSTCSIHAMENEQVVMEALRKSPDWGISPRSKVLPTWPHRGHLAECGNDKEVAEGLIRANPGDMGTIGFFVACFEKKLISKKRSHDDALFVADEAEANEDVDIRPDELTSMTSLGEARKEDQQQPMSTEAKRRKKKKKKKH